MTASTPRTALDQPGGVYVPACALAADRAHRRGLLRHLGARLGAPVRRLWWRLEHLFWGLAADAMWTQAIRCRRALALRQAARFRELARECQRRQNLAYDRTLGGP